MAGLRTIIRAVVDELTPPAIQRSTRKLWRVAHGLGWDDFFGSWPTLADVPTTKKIAEDDPWARLIAADWRRNLETAPGPTRDDVGRLYLPLLASQFAGPLTVLDFGGGSVAGLAAILQFSRLDVSQLTYVLVETPDMCRAVRDELEGFRATAVEEIPDALPRPLIVHAGSSVQYVPDFRATLARLARLEPACFLITRTPMTEGATYARQVLNTPHRKIASWVFNRVEFVGELQALGYRLVFSVDHDLPLTHAKAPGPSAIASMAFVPAASAQAQSS
jgi:putative methyltransferase (TIGR04325 family)